VVCGDSIEPPTGRLIVGARVPFDLLLAKARKEVRRDRTTTGSDGAGVGPGGGREQHGVTTARTVGERRLVVVARVRTAIHRDRASVVAARTLLVSGDSTVVRDVYIPVE
jgi:hypothetical protein